MWRSSWKKNWSVEDPPLRNPPPPTGAKWLTFCDGERQFQLLGVLGGWDQLDLGSDTAFLPICSLRNLEPVI